MNTIDRDKQKEFEQTFYFSNVNAHIKVQNVIKIQTLIKKIPQNITTNMSIKLMVKPMSYIVIKIRENAQMWFYKCIHYSH